MNKFYKVFTSIIIVLLSLIVVVLGIAFVQVNIMGKDYSNIFGYTAFQVATGSMEPTIYAEDFILVKLGNDIKENDIITFKGENEYITHRIVKINDDNTVVTKGDNNSSTDEPISKDQITGKVVYIVKNISIWKRVIFDYRVFVPVIITIVLFVISIVYEEKKTE